MCLNPKNKDGGVQSPVYLFQNKITEFNLILNIFNGMEIKEWQMKKQ